MTSSTVSKIKFFIVKFLKTPILSPLYNLLKLLANLSRLRTPVHINHFSQIHEIVLSKNWAEKNMTNIMLMNYYETMSDSNQKNRIRSRELKIYSQNGEDGILLYLFSKIGVKNKISVNIGCGGYSSNTANLMVNFGWGGLEIDGNDKSIQQSKKFLEEKICEELRGIYFACHWLTIKNINSILNDYGLVGEVDLLSIDLDGNDYWMWEKIDAIKPRVVIIEYNASFGPERSLSVKYDPHFDVSCHPTRWYHGASLLALKKLGRSKGYSLIACESHGVNAFFVRADLAEQCKLIDVSAKEAYYPHFQRKKTIEEQFEAIKHLNYDEI